MWVVRVWEVQVWGVRVWGVAREVVWEVVLVPVRRPVRALEAPKAH